jgi:hypothetical protein
MKGVRRKFERGCESKSVEAMESRNLKHVQFTEQAPDIMANCLYLPGIREMEATPCRLLGCRAHSARLRSFSNAFSMIRITLIPDTRGELEAIYFFLLAFFSTFTSSFASFAYSSHISKHFQTKNF